MKQTSIFLSILLFAVPLAAEEYNIPNTFEANTPARAQEVNANFEAGKAAVDDNHNRITTLEDQLQDSLTRVAELETLVETLNDLVDSLQTQLTAVQDNSVLALNNTLTLDDTGEVPIVRLTGANLQLVNGQDDTETVNGFYTAISGGEQNATGIAATASSVYGGQRQTADEDYSVAP